MSKILQKKLDDLKPYVIGIRFTPMTVVDTLFKDGWNVPTSKKILVGKNDENVNYHMFYSENEDITIDDLLNFIEETIKINIEREKKFDLLKIKVEELKNFFKVNTLSKLQNMKFILGDSNILPESMTEDFLHNDLSIEELDEIEEDVKPRNREDGNVMDKTTDPVYIGEVDPDFEVNQFNNRYKNQDIELPPKRGTKIEVENFEIPISDGPCTHGPDLVCPKCMGGLDY